MKYIGKTIGYLVKLAFLLVLIVLLFQQGVDLIRGYIQKRAQEIFSGKVEIGDLNFDLDKVHLLNVRIGDACDPFLCPLLSIEEVTVPLPYEWISDRSVPIPVIKVKGLKMRMFLDENSEWNVIKNLILIQKDKGTGMAISLQEVLISDSSFQIDVPVKKEKVSFLLDDVSAKVNFVGKRLFFEIKGKEKNIGLCSTRGDVDFESKDFHAYNNFEAIPLDNLANQRFIKLILPFFDHYDFKGSLALKIPAVFENKKWLPPKHVLKISDADLYSKDGLMKVENLAGELSIEKNRISAKKAKGDLYIQKLFLPLSNGVFQSSFDKVSFTNEEMKADVFQGEMESKSKLVFGSSFRSEYHFKECSLEEIANHYKQNEKPLKGRVFIDLDLNAVKEKNWNLEMEGEFHIREGEFFEYPFLVGFFNFLNFDFSSEKKGQKADVIWNYRKGITTFSEIKISGKTIDVYGEGNIGANKELDFTFTTELNRSNLLKIPIAGDITREVSNQVIKQLVTIKMSGTLDKPEFRKESIERIPQKAVGYFTNILKAISAPITGNGKKEKNSGN